MTIVKPNTIDEYIALFPNEMQKILNQVRDTIKKAAPMAGEKISYGMPTFTLNDTYLVYFAGYKDYIGFYPVPVKNENFKKALSDYKTGKGSVQFPLNKPIPLGLITKLVKFRIKENIEKAKTKK